MRRRCPTCQTTSAQTSGPARVGVAELEGRAPCVFKSYYATTDQYKEALAELGVPTTSRPGPSSAEVARHAPSLSDSVDSAPGRDVPPKVAGADDWDVDPGTGQKLTGFERANMARHIATERAKGSG